MNMNTAGAVTYVNKERPMAIPFVRGRGIENGQQKFKKTKKNKEKTQH